MLSLVQPVTALPVGAEGIVTEMTLSADTRARLMELGIVVGTPLKLIRFAPLGDPVEINVRGYNLTLRRHEAEHILVSVDAR